MVLDCEVSIFCYACLGLVEIVISTRLDFIYFGSFLNHINVLNFKSIYNFQPVGILMFSVFHTLLLQRVYEITGWDSRTVFSWSVLFMFSFVLDNELHGGTKWHREGGSAEMFRQAI